MSISALNWNYYLALERDLSSTFHYVKCCTDNYKTYSIEFEKIFLSICAEFDSVFKDYAVMNSAAKRPSNIEAAFKLLNGSNSLGFSNLSVQLLVDQGRQLQPLSTWSKGRYKKLGWWENYNGIKHDRSSSYKYANLKNCLNSLASLYLIEIASLREAGIKRLSPTSSMFSVEDKLFCRALPGQNGQWDLVIDLKELQETQNMVPSFLMTQTQPV